MLTWKVRSESISNAKISHNLITIIIYPISLPPSLRPFPPLPLPHLSHHRPQPNHSSRPNHRQHPRPTQHHSTSHLLRRDLNNSRRHTPNSSTTSTPTRIPTRTTSTPLSRRTSRPRRVRTSQSACCDGDDAMACRGCYCDCTCACTDGPCRCRRSYRRRPSRRRNHSANPSTTHSNNPRPNTHDNSRIAVFCRHDRSAGRTVRRCAIPPDLAAAAIVVG